MNGIVLMLRRTIFDVRKCRDREFFHLTGAISEQDGIMPEAVRPDIMMRLLPLLTAIVVAERTIRDISYMAIGHVSHS